MELKHVATRFYVTATGTNPVREWLMRLPLPDRKQLGHDIRDVEFGWPVGMPLCRSLGPGYGRSARPCRAVALRGCCFVSGVGG